MKAIEGYFLIKPDDLTWRPSNMMRIPTNFTQVYMALLPGPETLVNNGIARGLPIMAARRRGAF